MYHRYFAVSLIFGVNLSVVGPATSARNNWTPPIPSIGRIAIVNSIIPIPPIN